jgi:hypothetical protein
MSADEVNQLMHDWLNAAQDIIATPATDARDIAAKARYARARRRSGKSH